MDVEAVEQAVDEQQSWPPGDRPGDREPQQRIRGERQAVGGQRSGGSLREPGHGVVEPHHVERPLHVERRDLGAAHADVFRHGAGEGFCLAHEGDLQPRGGAVERAGVDAVEFEQPFVRQPEEAERLEEKRLARPRRADHGHPLTGAGHQFVGLVALSDLGHGLHWRVARRQLFAAFRLEHERADHAQLVERGLEVVEDFQVFAEL